MCRTLHGGQERMDKSETELRNGWSSYPADVWNQRRPPDHLGDLAFWTYCAAKYGGSVLDVCCGNGRISIPLAESGYGVVGVDINAGFVGVARDRASRLPAEGRPLRASFAVADVVRLDLGQRFRLAVMPDWGFQVLLTQEDQLSFLNSLRRHLVLGGAFAFNLFIPFYRQQGLVWRDGGFEWIPTPAYHNGAPRTYDPTTQIETLVEFNIHPIELRHTTLSELKLLFQATGFEIVEMYGDVDRRPFTGSRSDDYTIIAKTT
jgi:SAM-dependent methyltransferase